MSPISLGVELAEPYTDRRNALDIKRDTMSPISWGAELTEPYKK
jgi:hypothetical protein